MGCRPSRRLIPAAVLLAAAGCSAVVGSRSPEENGSGSSSKVGDLEFAISEKSADFLQEVLIFLGADRPPRRALRVIRDTHDLKDWSLRLDVPGAAEKTREALRDLTRSDYESWEETALVISIVSTLSTRDRASLIRSDCISTLHWFDGWVHPDAVALGRGPEPAEKETLQAMNVILDLAEKAKTGDVAGNRGVVIQAVEILGNHRWARVDRPEPGILRARLSRPRGVIRLLGSNRLDWCKGDPEVRAALDRALVRLADDVHTLAPLAALGDRAPFVRAAAAAAIRPDAADAVGPLAHALRREVTASVRLSLVNALGRLAGEGAGPRHPAVAALAGVLADPDASVRRAAARLLERATGLGLGSDPAAWRRWWRNEGPEKSGS